MHPKDTVLVPLTQGKFALVDPEDAERVLQLRWCAAKDHDTDRYYAIHSKNKRGQIKMHRFILGAPRHLLVDHINGDGLDNRRQNLRLATVSQNCTNKNFRVGISGFRGVRKSWNRWRAVIEFEGKKVNIGTFDTPEEAARAWDAVALRLKGEFARLNFPHEVSPSEG